jgi:opacity protein-like surface antigen
MLKTLSAAAVLATALVAPATAAQASPPPPDKMVIGVVAVNGSGCPQDSAAVTVSPDNTAFTVSYSQYTAQVGVGAPPTAFRMNCQIGLDVHVPQGYTYAIASTQYRGFAHLENGAYGSESANYYFQGDPQSTKIKHNFSGPLDSDWQTNDEVGVAALSFLRCGERRYLNINTELRVAAGSSNRWTTTSLLTMDSTDGNLDTIYHVAWKRC